MRPADVHRLTTMAIVAVLAGLAAGSSGCGDETPENQLRVSGQVEATEVRVSPEVGGRLQTLLVDEGARVTKGQLLATLDPRDTELAIARAKAERDGADASLRLLLAGTRPEDIRQAQAQVSAADAQVDALRAELASAKADLERFESLLRANAGSRKQRDDAATRVEVATDSLRRAQEEARAARATLARLRAGARKQEIEGARSRVAALDAQIATLQKALSDARIFSPAAGIVTDKLLEQGEIAAPRTPILVVTDLVHAWANLYVPEPAVPRLRIGQAVEVRTDAGDSVPGTLSFVSPNAEFTPRNVQTAEERSKLVYRIKVNVKNEKGLLKSGMPVYADITLQ
jgi:HlyD family secretion protein